MLHRRFSLALVLSLVATASLFAQTVYTWNPATTGNQTWDNSSAVWSNSGLGGPFDKLFSGGSNSSALLSTNGSLTLTSGTAFTLNDLRVASDGVTVATTGSGSFLVNQGFQTVGGARTLDLNVGGGNFTFQNVAPGNTTAGKLTLRISSTVEGGGAVFNTANAFGSTPNAEIVLNASSVVGGYGTRLTLNDKSMGTGVTLQMQANGTPDNRSTLRGTGNATWNGAIQLSGTGFTQLDVTNGSTFTVGGNIDSGTNATTLNLRTGTNATPAVGNLNGVVSGSTALWKSDPGVWQINQENNTFTGNVRVAAGTLRVTKLANGGQDSSLGRATTAIELGQGNGNDNATLEYVGTSASSTNRSLQLIAGTNSIFTVRANGTTNSATVSFSGTLTHVAGGSNRSLVFDGSNGGANTYSGAISGTLNVTKAGAGTWVLGGNNTYNGTTTVTAGTLVVNGGHTGTGLVTVGGGTLGGTGSLNGAVTVNAGGTIRGDSGTGTGALTTRSVTLLSDGRLAVEMGAGVTASRLNVAATGSVLNLNSGAVIDPNGTLGGGSRVIANLATGSGELVVNGNAIETDTEIGAYTFATGNSGLQDLGTSGLKIDISGLSLSDGEKFTLSRTGNDLVLAFTPVPEPAILGVVVAVAATGLAGWRRWRRNSTASR